MFDNQARSPWALSGNTDSQAWAEAFCDAFPEVGLKPLNVDLWFLCALQTGYNAGQAQEEFPGDCAAPPSA